MTKLKCVRGDDKFQPIAGPEFELKDELVLLAMATTLSAPRWWKRSLRRQA